MARGLLGIAIDRGAWRLKLAPVFRPPCAALLLVFVVLALLLR